MDVNSSNHDIHSDIHSGLHSKTFLVVNGFLVVCMVVIIVSSTLIIAAPVVCSVLRTPDNILMVFLAIADLAFGVVSIPIHIISRGDTLLLFMPTLGNCYMYQLTNIGPMAISLGMLEMMAVDRYLAVFYPFSYSARSKKILLSCVASSAVWIVTVILVAIGYQDFKYDLSIELHNRCNYINNFALWWQILIIIHLLASILICSLLTLLVVKQVQKIGVDASKLQKSKPDVKTNVYLLLVFLVFWVPLAVIALIATQSDNTDVHFFAKETVCILGALNSSTNAPVYAFCRKKNYSIYKLLLQNWPWRWGTIKRQLAVDDMRRDHKMMLGFMAIYNQNRDRDFSVFVKARRRDVNCEVILPSSSAVAESNLRPTLVSCAIGNVFEHPLSPVALPLMALYKQIREKELGALAKANQPAVSPSSSSLIVAAPSSLIVAAPKSDIFEHFKSSIYHSAFGKQNSSSTVSTLATSKSTSVFGGPTETVSVISRWKSYKMEEKKLDDILDHPL